MPAPLTQSLPSLTDQTDTAAASTLLPPPTSPLTTTLTHCLTHSAANSLPPITISPLAGQYLAIQSVLISATRILEVGTLGGYSTIHFASTGAHVTSLELSQHHASVAASNIEHAGYTSNVTIMVGDAIKSLANLKASGAIFDLVFIDADWSSQGAYFNAAVDLLRPKGCIYVDNVVRELFEEIEDGKDIVKESLLATVGRDERVMATMVTTASSHKGNEREALDGFLLAVKK